MPYSRFHLCDLQVHTPADHQQRYGEAGGRTPNGGFARRLVKAHANAGVRVLAVTDHNRVDWYPFLHDAGKEHGVAVLPGLEFSVNGCHLLAIWDSTEEGYGLAQRFLQQLFAPGVEPFTGTGPQVVTRGQVLELAKEIVDHRGLAFAPHSTQKKIGLFAAGVCSNSQEVAQSELLAGFDVRGNKKADVLGNPRSEFHDVPPRWFISGDTRSFESVGANAVYLKLGATPTLEGIRQAFLAPSTRVRFPSHLHRDWGHVSGVRFLESPLPSWPRLTRVRIEGGFHDGLEVQLAPGLNAIIGGKGTGKSALIEVLRYVLEAPSSKQAELQQNRRSNFGANADAAVGFVDESGEAYEARRGGGTQLTRLFRGDVESDVRVKRRIRVRVFGQRELQTLIDQPAELREFVASQAHPDWSDSVQEEKEILGQLELLASELDTAERDVARLEEQGAELADLKERLDRAIAQGAEDLLQRAKELESALRSIRQALGWPSLVLDKTEELLRLLPRPLLPTAPLPPSGLDEILEKLAKAVESKTDELKEVHSEVDARLPSIREAWESSTTEVRDQIERGLAEAGIANPQELSEIQSRVAELEEALASLPGQRDRATIAANKRLGLLKELATTRRKKSRLIDKAARSLNQAIGPKVRLRVEPLGDRTLLQAALEQALRRQSVRADQIQRLASADPVDVASAARLDVAEVERLGVSAGTAAKIVALEPSRLRSIEEVDTPDGIDLHINLGTALSEDWQPIALLSPGQRATALLALALAGGDEPLIVDQPEDDLDNRYIFAEVVQVLARVCEQRQVIVATHNANIPVLGDAEMVVALDAVADRSRVLVAGGLEDPKVAEQARQNP